MKSKNTHEEWKLLVTDYNKSGLTMGTFCKEKNLKPSTFIYWVKMFSKNIAAPKMIKLEVKPAPQKSDNIKIIVGNVKLEVTGVL